MKVLREAGSSTKMPVCLKLAIAIADNRSCTCNIAKVTRIVFATLQVQMYCPCRVLITYILFLLAAGVLEIRADHTCESQVSCHCINPQGRETMFIINFHYSCNS